MGELNYDKYNVFHVSRGAKSENHLLLVRENNRGGKRLARIPKNSKTNQSCIYDTFVVCFVIQGGPDDFRTFFARKRLPTALIFSATGRLGASLRF